MILQQVRDEANLINQLLSRMAHSANRRERRGLLQEAIDASLRALPLLSEEPLVSDTQNYLRRSYDRLGGNREALLEEMRHDTAVLRLFISAEGRLLSLLGVSSQLIESTIGRLVGVVQGPLQEPENLPERLALLQTELLDDLRALSEDARRSGTAVRVAGALGVFSGCILVAANAAGGIASVGLTAPWAAVSIAAGSSVIDRSLQDALSDN